MTKNKISFTLRSKDKCRRSTNLEDKKNKRDTHQQLLPNLEYVVQRLKSKYKPQKIIDKYEDFRD